MADANAQPWPHPEPKDPRTQAPDRSGVTVLADAAPLGKNFGDIKRDAKASYKPGTAVRVEFLGAHPNNRLMANGSYLQVQVKVDNTWKDIALDRDHSTLFKWARHGVAESGSP